MHRAEDVKSERHAIFSITTGSLVHVLIYEQVHMLIYEQVHMLIYEQVHVLIY